MDWKSFGESVTEKITIDICKQFEEEGYAIIDDFLDSALADKLLEEFIHLTESGVMIPNRTHFSSPRNPSQHYLFAKPGIVDVDMHQENIWPLVPNMYNVFEESRDIMVPNFIDLLKKTRLNSGDNNIRTMKLIHSDGTGGCFPCHYDNPGPPNNRRITCVLYLNKNWSEEEGGEISLYPFLKESLKVAPKMNRMVIFGSHDVLHRVQRSWGKRYCVTIWIDGPDTNTPENSQLKLPASALSDIDSTVKMLQSSPVQRSLSRAIYQEEYEISLHECMAGAEGRQEMVDAHQAHLEMMYSHPLLEKLITALRDWKDENVGQERVVL